MTSQCFVNSSLHENAPENILKLSLRITTLVTFEIMKQTVVEDADAAE